MDTTKADGSRLKINDPELAPIWETAARLNIPVIIHTAEPQEFFKPLDMHNERWLELALFAGRRRYLAIALIAAALLIKPMSIFLTLPVLIGLHVARPNARGRGAAEGISRQICRRPRPHGQHHVAWLDDGLR